MAEAAPRVFLSYSHDSSVHEERVLALSDRLREDGVEAEVDRYEEAPPDGWPLWMQRRVTEADFVLCICTDTYKRRVDGREEPGVGLGARWEGHLIREALYGAGAENSKFIPVLLEGATTDDIPGGLRSVTYYRASGEEDYERLYRRLTEQPEIRRPPLGRRRSLPPRPVTPAGWFGIPWPRNPFFVGRQDVLAQLRPARGVGSRHVLVGMGGVGKSQLALEHAFRVREERRAVLWTSAVSPADIESGFANLSRQLGLVSASDLPERAVESMSEWLAAQQDWLLIFDNVEDTTGIGSWLPPRDASGQVVLTSRHAGLARGAGIQELPVRPLSLDNTIDYLARRLARDPTHEFVTAATKLHEELGGLPLALAQAAAYLQDANLPILSYVAELQESRLRVLDRGSAGEEYSATVATTFRVSFEKLLHRSAPAADVLALTVGLAPAPIPVELLVRGCAELGDALSSALARGSEDPSEVWRVLSPLRDLSLAVVDPELETVTVHRLIREVVRSSMSEELRASWETRAVRALETSFPVANYLNWPLCDRFLPHARAAASSVERHGLGWDDAHHLLNEAASYLRMRGEYAAAERMHLQALANAERRWGRDHPKVATNYNNISLVYADQFDPERAIEWMRRAIAATGESGSWDDVALQYTNLAGLYVNAGKPTEASAAIKRAVAAIAPHLDEFPAPLIAHVRTVESLVEAESGHGEKAEELALEAARLRRPYNNDEYFARTDIALGQARLTKGDLPGALAALDAAVERRESVYGKSHSLVVRPLMLRSRVREALGDSRGAAADSVRAAAIRDVARTA